MVYKENLQKLLKQKIMIPFLKTETLRKISFLQDKVHQNIYNDFTIYNNIIKNNNIFVGTNSELEDLKELYSLLNIV